MSIHAFTGIPGSGKSLDAARVLRYRLNMPNAKPPCVANFPLAANAPVQNRDMFRYIPNEEMNAKVLIKFADDYWNSDVHPFREDFITLILDEAQILFNSRSWAQSSRMSYLEFLTQSRKYGYRVILISQNLMMIDNQFRMLVDVEYNHRRVSSMGPVGALCALPFRGNLFMIVRRLVQVNERLGMDLMVGCKRDMAMYDSYATFRRQDD